MLKLLSIVGKSSVAQARRMESQCQWYSTSVVVSRLKKSQPSNCSRSYLYYPMKTDDILNDRYRTVQEIGRGRYSTVWLVRDLRLKRELAVKVLTSDLSNDKNGWDEREVLEILRDHNVNAIGYQHICHLVDNFVLECGRESHTCLVTELMGPTVLDMFDHMPAAMPLFLVKRIAKHVLLALQYMHDECNIVHTDIKASNIFIAGLPPSPVLPQGFELETDDLKAIRFKLGGFRSANKLSNRYATNIQPSKFHAPEVIIGADWGTKVDIWDFGCLMYEFARGALLFDPGRDTEISGMSPSETRLAQISGLLGQFPLNLVRKAADQARYFDRQGNLLKGIGQPEYDKFGLQSLLSRADQPAEHIPLTVDLLSKALTIDPEERWSAGQLLGHPWLKDVS